MVSGIGTALLIFSLGFSNQADAWGLADSGLDMTIVAVGSSMIIAAAAQSRWRSPRIISPLVKLGQRSYEVYLTHMFVVFTVFHLFVATGESLRTVPILFVGVILTSSLLGTVVARFYSEPMNRRLRRCWGGDRTPTHSNFSWSNVSD